MVNLLPVSTSSVLKGKIDPISLSVLFHGRLGSLVVYQIGGMPSTEALEEMLDQL